MFNFNLDTDPMCVPYLSDKYIDDFCNDLIRRFEPGVIEHPHPVNIEQLAQKFLGLKLVYENLSCDGSVLGATIFENSDCFPVYDAKRRRARFIRADAGTVFIERALTEARYNNRYRFTVAHEAGHALWHSMYYRNMAKLGKARALYLSSETFKSNSSRSALILEHQADRSASALLMPKDAVKKLIEPMGACISRSDVIDRIMYTSSVFRVSDAAAKLRLRQLGLIDTALLKQRSA